MCAHATQLVGPAERAVTIAGLVLALILPAGAGEGNSEIDQSMMPLTITNPGSYVLTEELTGIAGESGITIASDDVKIDFNGFTLCGVPGSHHGVALTSNLVNLVLMNGTITHWDWLGIDAFQGANTTCRELTAHHNASNGIYLGFSATAIDCVAYSNGLAGIEVENGSTVRDCVSWGNHEHGLDVHSGSTVIDCTMNDNGHDGIHGSHAVTLIRCVTDNNAGEGIEVDTGGKIENCTARNNRDDGIKTQGEGSTIINCWTSENIDDGFDLASGSLIRNSTSVNNGDEGIRSEYNCTIMNCTSERNAQGAGIKAVGDGNRIEGNLVTANKRGVHVQGIHNAVMGNMAHDNTSIDFSIAPSNFFRVISSPGDTFPDNAWINFQL